MRNSFHRRDLVEADFALMAMLKGAIWQLVKRGQLTIYGTQDRGFQFPVWYETAGLGWRFLKLKQSNKECVLIYKKDFRRLCRFVKLKESEVLNHFYKFSMLAVRDGSDRPKKCRFIDNINVYQCYVIEKRRMYESLQHYPSEHPWYIPKMMK